MDSAVAVAVPAAVAVVVADDEEVVDWAITALAAAFVGVEVMSFLLDQPDQTH